MLGSLEDVLGVVCIGQGKSLPHSIYANRLISKSNMPFLPFSRIRLYSSRTLVGFQNCQPPPSQLTGDFFLFPNLTSFGEI